MAALFEQTDSVSLKGPKGQAGGFQVVAGKWMIKGLACVQPLVALKQEGSCFS